MLGDNRAVVRFGDFEFDPASGELRRAGVANRLSPQTSAVLGLLVARRGDVVTRAELREALWPDTTVEFDQGLNFCIRQLRIALEDDAGNPRYIETLHRRGYRFVAVVESATAEPEPVRPSVEPRRVRRPWLVGGVVVAAALSAVAFAAFRPHRAEHRLAVLAFDAAPDDSALSLYQSQLVQALVASTGRERFHDFAVMGPSFTSRFGGMMTPPDSIRDALGATHVLSGGLQRENGGTRVFAQLIRTSDRRHIYAARFFDAGAPSQMSVIADSIARAVRAMLEREHL